MPNEYIDHSAKVLRIIREAVGWEVTFCSIFIAGWRPMHSTGLSRALEEFKPYWFEEPC